jgi:hypothetical protein
MIAILARDEVLLFICDGDKYVLFAAQTQGLSNKAMGSRNNSSLMGRKSNTSIHTSGARGLGGISSWPILEIRHAYSRRGTIACGGEDSWL